MKHLLTFVIVVMAIVISACTLQPPQVGVVNTVDMPEQTAPADPTAMPAATPVVAVPGSNVGLEQTSTIAPWKVDQSPPNVVWYYGCEVVAGIQSTYSNGQCIWRTENPNQARHVWVPAAYIANAGTNGELEYGPCTYAGVHGGISFTLPTNVVLTDDESLWNWEPPKCDLDTTKELDEDGNLINRDQTQTNTSDQAANKFPPCPTITDFKLDGEQDEFGGCPYVTTVAGGAPFIVPDDWWGYTSHKNYPPGNAGKQGGVTLYPGTMPN